MQLTRLLDTTNVSLSTAAAAVTAPATLDFSTAAVVVAAESGGYLVEWERQKTASSTYSAFCDAAKEAIPIKANPSQTIFYAKVSSGTATLDVEWWG